MDELHLPLLWTGTEVRAYKARYNPKLIRTHHSQLLPWLAPSRALVQPWLTVALDHGVHDLQYVV